MFLEDVIARVRQMESCLDLVLETMENAPESVTKEAEVQDALRKLAEYYENGQWLQDYEIDELGLLPEDLKRGVLAEDMLYDLLDELEWGKDPSFAMETPSSLETVEPSESW